MKLTKELEEEILTVYNAYWDAYLKGDMKQFANMLDEDLSVFGTAISEVFNNKEEAVSFYNATAEQMVGKADFRNRQYTVQLVGDSIFIREQNDLFVLLENEWSFYAHARVTAIFRQQKGEWKLVHQHASFPDNRAEEGEQIAAEKIKQENLDLREAVKRRTVELEYKNRELEIEASLERVRSRSMAMHSSDELGSVVTVLLKNLHDLGFVTENGAAAHILIFNSETKDFVQWSADPFLDKPVRARIPYAALTILSDFFEEKEKGLNFFTKVYPRKQKDEFFEYAFKNSDLKHLPDDLKQLILASETYTHWMAIEENSAISVNSMSGNQLSENQIDILKRFARVFEQAYIRFLDLQKAEEQTRGSQIELGLERVRARTMAMQHSNELQEAAILLFDQMKALGIQTGSCGFNIWNKTDASATVWMSSPEGGLQPPFTLPLTKSAIYKEVYKAMKNGEDLLVKEVTGKNLIKHFDYLLTLPGIGDVIKRLRETGYLFPESIVFHFAFFSQGYLSFHLREPDPPAHDIFIRFAKVFDQTYTRFLDLEKAEFQAKEARIEAALERIRSRSLAMHQSEELQEVVTAVFDQLRNLGIETDAINLDVFNDDKKNANLWTAVPGHSYSQEFRIPYNDTVVFRDIYEGLVAGKDLHSKVYSRKEKDEFLAFIFEHTDFKHIPEERKAMLFATEASTVSVAYAKHIAIIAQRYRKKLFSDEENEILVRFAKVFEQAYVRFLDLQKAEAQAREAHIEASLERVRSRTMAMHKSEELKEIIIVVSEQLKKLGYKFSNVTFVTHNANYDLKFWMSATGVKEPFLLQVPYLNNPAVNNLKHAVENDIWFSTAILTADESLEWNQHVIKTTWLKNAPQEIKNYLLRHTPYAITNIRNKQIAFAIGNYAGIPYKEDENEVFKRFANVFEQSYTRFLDLQRAEAQAREAQIEAALERVRAKSMAMHSSHELKDVITVVIKQFVNLGFDLDLANFNYLSTTKEWIMWLATPDYTYPELLKIPAFDHPLFNRPVETVMKGLNFMSDTLTQDEFRTAWQHFYNTSPLLNEQDSAERKEYIAGCKGFARSIVFMKQIALTISNFNGVPYTEEQNNILRRFANVFEQTYTRFLDLQKAEAQAREAQIELGLERVRARAMAMQKSDELKELIGTVFTELTKLDLVLTRCLIMIYDPKTKGSTWWMANSEAPSDPIGLNIKYHEHPPYTAYLTAWQERKNKWQYILEGTDKKDWDDFLFMETELCNLPDFVIEGMKDPDRVYLNASFNSFGNLTLATLEPLSNEQFDIMLRFAKVFDLTYTRFNDLQKAEVQAREAKIEASLERIRAKAMAMHRSEEIDEVLEVLFDQFDVLGIVPMSTHLTLIDINTNSFTFRETGKGGRKSFGEQKVQIDSMDIWKEAADKWKAMEPLSLNKLHFPKEALPLVWQVFHESFASMPEGHKIMPEDYPDGIYHTAGNCKFGYLGMNQVRPATEEEEQIVLKFAVEFGRLYQRYLDLQKAEAQTKEAKIEAALERVRSSSLAMHKSEELKNVVKVVFENLESLGIKNINSVNINILHPDTKNFDLWLAAPGQDYTRNFRLPYFDHPISNDFFEAIENGESLHRRIYGFEVKNKYFGYMFEHSDNKHLPEERKKLILNGPAYAVSAAIANYSSIFIHNYSGIPFSDEENNILLRFTRVFDQTYTRFLDLQKVEAQAREARIEVSLERVRSKAMAMHSSRDLADTIASFYNELQSFSITPRRCGVGLLNKETRIAELSTMNTTGAGDSIEVIGTVKMIDHPVLDGVYQNWLIQKEYHPVLRGAEIPAYYKLLKPQIGFPDYPDDAVQYGYFFFFPEGGVYAWTEKDMSEEELTIYRRFTSVLSLTYKRYKDLQQAEELARKAADDLINLKLEKKRTEDALTELKNTQSQLVQAEKMASLGELTAGIAHEIQNPLNFVNNFSEVNLELIDELKEQLAPDSYREGNMQEAIEIANDLKQNLEKILHHGKRADGIVKGMLQHSRTSSGQKELTDINNLADEYLRLAFHGLRAKDKSFNAELKTDFDNSIGKIEIIPQDIGRVLVNLLNNAFYAVNDKRKKATNGYEPVVMVSTKKMGDRLELRVTDNGNGIPEEALEKIFQPFFTTKPTGQGTGLGLSLSYDIVKSHGGELIVHTESGKGSEFIIALPA